MSHFSNPSSGMQLVRSDRNMVALSDDNMMMKQILATHTPDGREVDVKPVYRLIEDILKRATLQDSSTDPVY